MTDRSDNDYGEDSASPKNDRSPAEPLDQAAAGTSADVESLNVDPDTKRDEEQAAALALLAHLRTEHRRIDQEIHALVENGVTDILKIGRMKKIKLSIKDQIAYLENQTTPDIIA